LIRLNKLEEKYQALFKKMLFETDIDEKRKLLISLALTNHNLAELKKELERENRNDIIIDSDSGYDYREYLDFKISDELKQNDSAATQTKTESNKDTN